MLEPVIDQPNETVVRPAPKLLVSGFIYLESIGNLPVEVRRGMSILTQDGIEVGTAAAVMVDSHGGEVTHVLFGQVPPTSVYRLVSISLVEQVDGETIRLRATAVEIEKLPLYQPDT